MRNKVFLSSVVALLTSFANAKGIDASCLILSDQTAGQQTGTEFTHETKLTSEDITDEMRLQYVEMCTDGEDGEGLTYIKFILQAGRLGVPLQLDPIGAKTDLCEMINVSDGGITKLHASSNERGSGVNAIKYKIGSDSETKPEFGELNDDTKRTWRFTAEQPLIGLYGRSGDAIDQLGFIQLDVACQANYMEMVEVVEEEVVEEYVDAHSGLEDYTFLIIGLGIVVFIAVLVSARRWNQKKQANRRISNEPPKQSPDYSTRRPDIELAEPAEPVKKDINSERQLISNE